MKLAALVALIAAGALAPAAVGAEPRTVVVGPGAVARTIAAGPYRVAVGITPNAAGRRPNTFVVRTSRDGKPVRGRRVGALHDAGDGDAAALAAAPAAERRRRPRVGETLTMPGRWNIALHVVPRGAPAFDVAFVDVVAL